MEDRVLSKSGSGIGLSLLSNEDDTAVLPTDATGLVGDSVVLERTWAAGEEDACARALDSKAAARAAWLALVGEPPDTFFGGMALSRAG